VNIFLTIVTYLFGFIFIYQGFLWLTSPAQVAESLGMPLLEGEGLSTQIGDFASFFFVVGLFILLGAYSKNKYWFYAPIALLLIAAISRCMAYFFHEAAFATQSIMIEVLVACFLLFQVSRKKSP
tara:strand:- start:619 stop:993 length:375 start_codon:yes stop_codon:yes gene_type:complete